MLDVTRTPPVGRSAVHLERRRPASPRGHSGLFSRLCLILLVAPWLLILSLRDIIIAQGLSTQLFFFLLCLELAIVTFAGLVLVNARIRDLRRYEAGREHERLLFSYARDGMLLIQVKYSSDQNPANISFIVQAENPTAVERLRAMGQPGSYVGRDIESCFPTWLRKQVRAEYTACVTSNEVRRYEVRDPDSKLMHETVATPVFDPVRQVITHVIVVMRDITERMLHQHELAAALKKAETASKAKSEFLASMSHELRTPLNAVLGFSEAMSAGIGGALSDKQKEYTQHIHQSGSHLLSIISDILDLAKIEAGQVLLQEAPVNVHDLVESCLLMVRERASSKGVAVRVELPPGLPVIKADPMRLKQILINLLSNGIKFTEQGGVLLTAAYHAKTGFEFVVADTGIGMTKAELEVALRPFGQVEAAHVRNHDGTGLGLPIARQLAALHGGTIEFSSARGLGTRATVLLPSNRIIFNLAPTGQTAAAL